MFFGSISEETPEEVLKKLKVQKHQAIETLIEEIKAEDKIGNAIQKMLNDNRFFVLEIEDQITIKHVENKTLDNVMEYFYQGMKNNKYPDYFTLKALKNNYLHACNDKSVLNRLKTMAFAE